MLLEVPDNLRHLIPAELCPDVPDHGSLAGREAPPITTKIHDFYGTEIRIIDSDPDNIRFIAQDVCQALGLSDTSMAIARLDDDEKGTSRVCTPGGPQNLLDLTVPGAFHLIRTTRGMKADSLGRWLDHEVLPSVQQTGSYSVNEQALKSLEARLTEKIAGLTIQFGEQQGVLAETKLELYGTAKELEAATDEIGKFDERAEDERLAADAKLNSAMASVTRAADISTRQKRKGRRSLRRDEGWYMRADICQEMPLPSYWGRHYGHKCVYPAVLGKVMWLWKWTVWSRQHQLYLLTNPPFIPGFSYQWAPVYNKENDPNDTSYHWELYLREAGIKLILDRWHQGLHDRSLSDNIADVVSGKADRPAPAALQPPAAQT